MAKSSEILRALTVSDRLAGPYLIMYGKNRSQTTILGTVMNKSCMQLSQLVFKLVNL